MGCGVSHSKGHDHLKLTSVLAHPDGAPKKRKRVKRKDRERQHAPGRRGKHGSSRSPRSPRSEMDSCMESSIPSNPLQSRKVLVQDLPTLCPRDHSPGQDMPSINTQKRASASLTPESGSGSGQSFIVTVATGGTGGSDAGSPSAQLQLVCPVPTHSDDALATDDDCCSASIGSNSLRRRDRGSGRIRWAGGGGARSRVGMRQSSSLRASPLGKLDTSMSSNSSVRSCIRIQTPRSPAGSASSVSSKTMTWGIGVKGPSERERQRELIVFPFSIVPVIFEFCDFCTVPALLGVHPSWRHNLLHTGYYRGRSDQPRFMLWHSVITRLFRGKDKPMLLSPEHCYNILLEELARERRKTRRWTID
eukprot:TRINITY_DN9278_c0_g1_i2.p1 TRINITY_DN9278_c0_g1~~TRINITY_DN9278_c0_g1_i2.p1  ORF type:complete len:362 (+),score=37.92 TRINITY_DN9278_c0_g1_i2:141-1226(+)